MNTFLSAILILTSGIVYSYGKLREHFSDRDVYYQETKRLRSQLERQELLHQAQMFEMERFKQEVATLMPEVLRHRGNGENGYSLRNLASVVSSNQGERHLKTKAHLLFGNAKKNFNQGRYHQAIQKLHRLINEFSFSTQVVESYFLLAESQFKLRQFDDCLKTVESMVELFPESELTGFALLRSGKIYELQNRQDEAAEIYQTVLRSFPQRTLASQARISLQAVDL